jgi:hypothetical protein
MGKIVRIFISFASEQEHLAEPVALALRRRRHSVFFSHDDLPAGGNFDERIERAIAASDLFVFLISPESVAKGRYTLTELSYARMKWPDPTECVLPVMLVETPLEKVPGYLKGVTILEPAGNVAAETAAAIGRLGGSSWLGWARDFGAPAVFIVSVIGFLIWYFISGALVPEAPSKVPEPWTPLNSFFVNVPIGASEEPHRWSRNGDYWLEQIVNGRTMRHKVNGRISLNSCNGTVTKKEEDSPLQFFIPDIGCPGMTMLFRRDNNPWVTWLPMLKINDTGGESSKPVSKVTRVCMGEGGGSNCLATADAKFDCNVYYSWGNGGKMNENLGANFCSVTENGTKKQLPFDIKVYQNNGGGKCGWIGYLVTCNP